MEAVKIKFSKDFLLDVLDGAEGEIISDELTGTSRWSVRHRLIFKHEDKFYSVPYSVGATECQDESPWEYSGDEIEVTEVKPVEKVVTVYEEVSALT